MIKEVSGKPSFGDNWGIKKGNNDPVLGNLLKLRFFVKMEL